MDPDDSTPSPAQGREYHQHIRGQEEYPLHTADQLLSLSPHGELAGQPEHSETTPPAKAAGTIVTNETRPARQPRPWDILTCPNPPQATKPPCTAGQMPASWEHANPYAARGAEPARADPYPRPWPDPYR